MEPQCVRDVMLPLDDVPTVSVGATLLDAVCTLERAQVRRPAGASRYRFVLVLNEQGQVVGKLGHLAFLRAIEPGFERPRELEALDRAGVDADLIDSISRYRRLWQEGLRDCCRRVAQLRVADVMRPVDESIADDAPLLTAVSTLVRLQSLSIPVRRGDLVVGVLRLADLYDVIANQIAREGCGDGAAKE